MAVTTSRKRAPGLRQLVPIPMLGPMARSRRDPLGFLLEGLHTYGDVFRYRVGPYLFHQLAHPDHVRHVLVDAQKNYPKSWYYDRTRIVAGAGLFNTEGATWRRLRRMAQPAFHPQRVASFATTMTDMAALTFSRWHEFARSGQPLDVVDEFIELTLRIAGKTMLSIDLGGEADTIGPAITVALQYLQRRLDSMVALPLFVPTPGNLRVRECLKVFDTVAASIIAQRRRGQAPESPDLLALLLAVRDEENGQGLSDLELRDQILTFIAAGHETTAVALAWTVYLLCQHPQAEERLRAEVAGVLAGRTPTAADLPRLAFTRQVLEESLRLYPPVVGLLRDATIDDEIGGYHIPARSMIILSPYVTHRHPEFWPDPEGFDPDRFTPERIAARPRFAWYPFLGGPHQCIGQEFAMMEATLVLAMLTQAFRLELVPGVCVRPKVMISLRPAPGVPVRVRPA